MLRPQSVAALDLRQRAVRIHHRPGVHDDRQLLDHHPSAAPVDPHARDASDPGRHIAFLPERGRNAEPESFGMERPSYPFEPR